MAAVLFGNSYAYVQRLFRRSKTSALYSRKESKPSR